MTMFESPNVIHIEPSTGGSDGFPVEIGLVLHNGGCYCLVTQPDDEGYAVDPKVEASTGLSREVRAARGQSAVAVARQLNIALADDTVYFDAHDGSDALLQKVFEAAGIPPAFRIEPLQSLLSTDQQRDWKRASTLELDEQRQIRNRASDKALILQQTFVRSVGRQTA